MKSVRDPRRVRSASLEVAGGLAGALGIAALTFAYRLATIHFHNDHFDPLAKARQILAGERPGVDFFDFGRPLTLYLSAAADHLSSHALIGEALLTIAGLSVAAGLAYLVAYRSSGSRAAAVAAVFVLVALEPRPYNYPKLLTAAVALWLFWRFALRPDPRRAAALGVWTGIAFLFRHDLGVFVGVASLACLLWVPASPFVHRPVVRRHLTPYAVGAAVIVAPYLSWLFAAGVLFSTGAGGAARLFGAVDPSLRPFDLRWESPLVVGPLRAVVRVRWRADVGDEARARAEADLGLLRPRDQDPPSTWTYDLGDDGPERVRAVVTSPLVEDTFYVDRGTFDLQESAWRRAARRFHLPRVAVAPWAATAYNAETWMHWTLVLPALMALVIVAFSLRSGSLAPEIVRVVVATAVLALLMDLFLIRGNLDSRLPDVSVPAVVLLAFVVSSTRRLIAPAARASRLAAWGGLSLAALLTWGSLAVMGGREPVGRVTGALWRARSTLPGTLAGLTARPLDRFAPPGSTGVQGLTRWIHECTRPDDRVLVIGYHPEVFYYAERLFAGGLAFCHSTYHADPASQQLTVERLSRQSVPIVLVSLSSLDRLEGTFGTVNQYLAGHFVVAAESGFGGDEPLRVLIDPGRPIVRRSSFAGLPCFTPGT